MTRDEAIAFIEDHPEAYGHVTIEHALAMVQSHTDRDYYDPTLFVVGDATAAAEVPRTNTPLSELDVARALRSAYQELFDEDPTHEILGVAWSQIALENARGQAIYDFNFGNITGTGENGFYALETDEQVAPGVWKRLTLHYAAHPDAGAGARAYWRLITGAHYRPVFDAEFKDGNASGATMHLHALGYFTANPEPIAVTMGNLYRHFSDVIAPSLGGLGSGAPKDGDELPSS
jgi:hypothetical protein